jgi:demethylmenaquinone methyltransferase / 2-methoxy-6-polyprenyl-1,4-benzoquinol methylase
MVLMSEHAVSVRNMFSQIAARYDRLNRIMTLGFDIFLRREAVKRLEPQNGQWILDDGAGTGDLIFEVLRRAPDTHLVASDFTPAMLRLGQQRDLQKRISWVLADAQNLPFAPGVFEGLVSGYLLRNVSDLDCTLKEQKRVLKAGGRLVSLDTTPPQDNLLRPLINFYLGRIIPLLGQLFAGNTGAYTYLPQSTQQFLSAEQLAGRMAQVGFNGVGWVRRLFGSMAIHWARK